MAVIYARQSLDRPGDGLAVDRQVQACREHARLRGWTVTDVLVDNDVSASTGAPRPAYERVLDQMRAGVDVVVVYHLDRLARRLVDLERVIAICETSGTRLATVTGDLDLSTDTGRMVARILASVARGEVERKGRRQRDANRQAATHGRARWVRRPFGYDKDETGRVVVVEQEAEAIRRAVKATLAGASLGAIAREWNASGLTTTPGGQWRTSPVRRAISNPRLAGRSMYKGQDLGTGDWPPILDPDTLAQVEDVLSDPRRRTAFNVTARHLLSGIAICGLCSETMYGTPTGHGERRWMAYRCLKAHLMRRMDLVDEVVEAVVVARLSRPDALALLTPDVDVDALRARAASLRDRRDALAAMLADGLLSPAAVRTQAARIADELTRVESDIAAATGDNPAAALAAEVDVATAWVTLPLQTKRKIITTLMDVTILPVGRGARFTPDQVEITWRAQG